MNIKKSEHSGFCFGVKRAVDEALKLNDDVKTLGPLIHNPQVTLELEKKGVKAVDSIDNIQSGTLLIRTHGVPDSVIAKAKEKGLKVIDLTCPFVKKVQDYAKELNKEGYKVVVVGEKDHPEVLAILGDVDGVVVSGVSDAEKLGKFEKLGIVAQTTQSIDNFDKTVDELKKHSDEVKVYNTVCSATRSRQEAAIKLAKEVDLMVVVGGYNSANTRRLAEICSDIVDTVHIETATELSDEIFDGINSVGVTAGASTPDNIIEEVMEKIKGC